MQTQGEHSALADGTPRQFELTRRVNTYREARLTRESCERHHGQNGWSSGQVWVDRSFV